MPVVLGYGSLLNVESLRRTLPQKGCEDLRSVRVPGFRRLFNLIMLRMARRCDFPDGQRIGALNAVPDPAEELGAVAFHLDETEFEPLDRREYCYFKIEEIPVYDFVTGERVEDGLLYSVYSAGQLAHLFPERYREEIAPLGADGLLSSAILPGDDYLTLCLQGAYSWSEAFGDHFLEHSYLADATTTIREYLSREEVDRRREADIHLYLKNR